MWPISWSATAPERGLVFGFASNLEVQWEIPGYSRFIRRLASFCRLLLFDKRGTGLSDRVPITPRPPQLV
jgi:hypothetical protein